MGGKESFDVSGEIVNIQMRDDEGEEVLAEDYLK
jgi:hypothetical protein